ncbi:hypothetical protein A6R68_10301, partial [Neotoma lepida]
PFYPTITVLKAVFHLDSLPSPPSSQKEKEDSHVLGNTKDEKENKEGEGEKDLHGYDLYSKSSPREQGASDLMLVKAYTTHMGPKGGLVVESWEQTQTPQAFSINLAPGPKRLQEWYPWEAKDRKELCKAVAEDSLNSPWSQTLLQDIAYNHSVPKDWLDLPKAILSGTKYVKWCAHYKEECRVWAEANGVTQPAIPITYGMLAGTADRYSMGIQQDVIPGPYGDQVQQAGLTAWAKLDEGPIESPIARVRQKPSDTLPEIIDRVQQSINGKLLAGPLRDQFMKILIWDGMNSEHRAACAWLKEASMSWWVVATQDLGT